MLGTAMGTLKVYKNSGSTSTEVFSVNGNQGDQWYVAQTSLTGPEQFQVMKKTFVGLNVHWCNADRDSWKKKSLLVAPIMLERAVTQRVSLWFSPVRGNAFVTGKMTLPSPLSRNNNKIKFPVMIGSPWVCLFNWHSSFYEYGGHFEFYCFKYLLWDAEGAICRQMGYGSPVTTFCIWIPIRHSHVKGAIMASVSCNGYYSF